MAEMRVIVEGGSLATNQTPPTAANILAKSVTATNSAAAVTIITIPAGKTWTGTINAQCENAVTVTTNMSAVVSTAGTGVTPAAGAILTVLGSRDTAVTSTTITGVTVIAPAGNAVTLTLTLSAAATTLSGAASAYGILS